MIIKYFGLLIVTVFLVTSCDNLFYSEEGGSGTGTNINVPLTANQAIALLPDIELAMAGSLTEDPDAQTEKALSISSAVGDTDILNKDAVQSVRSWAWYRLQEKNPMQEFVQTGIDKIKEYAENNELTSGDIFSLDFSDSNTSFRPWWGIESFENYLLYEATDSDGDGVIDSHDIYVYVIIFKQYWSDDNPKEVEIFGKLILPTNTANKKVEVMADYMEGWTYTYSGSSSNYHYEGSYDRAIKAFCEINIAEGTGTMALDFEYDGTYSSSGNDYNYSGDYSSNYQKLTKSFRQDDGSYLSINSHRDEYQSDTIYNGDEKSYDGTWSSWTVGWGNDDRGGIAYFSLPGRDATGSPGSNAGTTGVDGEGWGYLSTEYYDGDGNLLYSGWGNTWYDSWYGHSRFDLVTDGLTSEPQVVYLKEIKAENGTITRAYRVDAETTWRDVSSDEWGAQNFNPDYYYCQWIWGFEYDADGTDGPGDVHYDSSDWDRTYTNSEHTAYETLITFGRRYVVPEPETMFSGSFYMRKNYPLNRLLPVDDEFDLVRRVDYEYGPYTWTDSEGNTRTWSYTRYNFFLDSDDNMTFDPDSGDIRLDNVRGWDSWYWDSVNDKYDRTYNYYYYSAGQLPNYFNQPDTADEEIIKANLQQGYNDFLAEGSYEEFKKNLNKISIEATQYGTLRDHAAQQD